MDDVMGKVEEMIKNEDFKSAHKVLTDSLNLPAWKEKYGTHMLVAQAYCALSDKENRIDTIEIRKSIENLVEQRILDMPPFWQKLAFEIDSKLDAVEMM